MSAYAKPIRVNAYTCPKCKFTIYSRGSFDLHTCYCGSVECTGKLTSYAAANGVNSFESSTLDINASVEEMLQDLKYNGTLGTIKPKK